MTYTEALLLGIVQGITEFLPISSSGHLVIFQSVLGIEQSGNAFEVIVHLGTLTSIIIVFFRDIKDILFSVKLKKTQSFIYLIFIGTLPSVIIGLGFKENLESLFDNIFAVGFALIFTGIFLTGTLFIKMKNNKNSISKALIIGLSQSIAIIPGISRSGFTITTALLLGLNSKDAAKFSFLLAIPAISGAGILTAVDINMEISMGVDVALIGFCSSFIMGFISLKWLLNTIENGKFYFFGIYCFFLGIIIVM